MTAEKTAGKQRGKPFKKGVSGNPKGKPRGARHRVTIMAERLMATDAKAVVESVITAAKSGDMVAARLVLERIAPARKGRLVSLSLPNVMESGDVTKAIAVVIAGMAGGELSPEEAAAVATVLEQQRKGIETVELERRLAAIEAKLTEDGK